MITESLIKGGKERRLVELLRYFEYQNIDIQITLVLLKEIIQYPEIHDFRKVNLVVIKFKIKKDPTVFFKLQNICRNFKPHLIHSWGSMPSVYSFMIAKMSGIPFLNAMIADSYCKPFSKNWTRAKITFPFSDLIIANTRAGLKAYHAPVKKGRVVYNGFNLDRLKNTEPPAHVKEVFGIKTKYIVGMIGAFHPRKDYVTYLNAAEQMCSEGSDITFLAIGDGESRNQFMEKYISCPQIIFTGNTDHVEALVSIFDIGVLLTDPKVHNEGISNAIIEMMAFSKVVIATRGGGTEEIIDSGMNGILIDPYSVTELIDNISRVLQNTTRYQTMKELAKEKIRKDFSIEAMGSATLSIYDELISENN
jgi:glycosyltransferase involved in cell wall biosynthesis